uniref:Axin n=1 Tax=Ciona savignyi TaxID=51511 RepID=H2YF52_CIOSA
MQNAVQCGFKGQDSVSMVHAFMLGHNFTKCTGDLGKLTVSDLDEVTGDSRQSTRSSLSGKSGTSATSSLQDKWKKSLCSLLNDSEGVKAFQMYLWERGQDSILKCMLAMRGFRNFGVNENAPNGGNSTAAHKNVMLLMDEETKQKRLKLAKQIYKSFLGNSAPKCISNSISTDTKQNILATIRNAGKTKSGAESDLFHEAQIQIESYVESNLYKSFLASEKFYEYNSTCEANNKTPSSSQATAQPNHVVGLGMISYPYVQVPVTTLTQDEKISQPGYLPRLDENQVWNPTQNRHEFQFLNLLFFKFFSIIRKAIMGASRENQTSNNMDQTNQHDANRPAAPYYTTNTYSVPPASAIGSDQASRSSDATSDTLSCTDNSSMDGPSYSSTRTRQKLHIRNQIKNNPANVLPEYYHQPRTARCKDIPTLATNDPPAFFAKLCAKLEKVVEEQKRAKQAQRVPEPCVFDEDMEKMMESHLARVIHSPGEQNVLLPNNGLAAAQTLSYPSNKGDPANPDHQRFSESVKKEVPRRRVEQPAVGLVPGMPQNEVPDIPTPVNPVDKNQMINAWIQQAPVNQRKKHAKVRRSVAPDIETVPEGVPIFPEGSTGLTSAFPSARAHRTPLVFAQDMMPPMEQPDANTIEEVKRRLIEETEDPKPAPRDTKPPCETVSDTDSSTETATSANTMVPGRTAPTNEATSTTVVYLPHEPVAYKIHIPHCPLTLGQFKAYITTRNNCKYFFKHFSPDLGRVVFFEVTKENEVLPLWDEVVLAKIEYTS